jgi:microtubule-associated protein-like 6
MKLSGTGPPLAGLELEYIYGYRCHDVRNNLRYTEEGKIVYHAAGAGVVLDQTNNT